MPEAKATQTRNRLYRCSFCGKSQTEVKTLISGPGVFICDECVQLCQPIIDKKPATQAPQEVRNPLLPDNAPTENLLKPSPAHCQINGAKRERYEAEQTVTLR